MRLIVVLLSVPGHTLNEGARNRSADGMALLSYGFKNFTTVELDAPPVAPVRVWKGDSREVAMAPSGVVRITARKSELESLEYRVVLSAPVVAPIVKGQEIGALVYSSGTEEVGRIPLLATTDVEAAGLLRRMWDSVVLGVSSIVGGAAAALR
jgi:D-alanyl-D-alanine carboxypeptidase (penicillin-binding protein 5/6)